MNVLDRSARVVLRDLDPDNGNEVAALARLVGRAYPRETPPSSATIADDEKVLRIVAHDPGTRFVLAYRDERLTGAMRLFDFTMRVRDADAFTGGVGVVAVDYPYKKQGIARTLVRAFLSEYRERKAPFAALHPFRPDFYRALGFGYGAKVHRYSFAPQALPDNPGRRLVRLLGVDDLDAVLACYERVRAQTHGLIAKMPASENRALGDPARTIYGYEEGGTLRGMVTTLVSPGERSTANTNQLIARDLYYEDATALRALLGFLRVQADQFEAIVIPIQHDDFHLVASDPRDGSNRVLAAPAWHRTDEAGLGIMYRILDVDAALAYLNVHAQPIDVRLEVSDGILEGVAGSYVYRLGAGRPVRLDDGARYDVELAIAIPELSSLVMGAVRLRTLAELGIVAVEEPWLGRLDRAFAAERPPRTTTIF